MPLKTTMPQSLEHLTAELRELEARLRLGGGEAKIERLHAQGKLTARERIAGLLDPGSPFLEIGLLVAYDRYDGQAPAAGVVTGIGRCHRREIVVVANDPTVKAGAWFPETITKMLRAQEVAMRCRVPIVYLVDSAGVNLPYQGGVFPGQYGAARLFYYNSLMRRHLRIPQLAAVMGQCIAGGAYLPALSDVIVMVEGTSFMGLGGVNLVRGATGQTSDPEALGGARMHTTVSGVAHYREPDDAACLARLRRLVAELPPPPPRAVSVAPARPPRRDPREAYHILPADHRLPYDVEALLDTLLDADSFDEFQADYAREMICAHARVEGIPVGLMANRRGLIKSTGDRPPRFGGIVYRESAEKVAYFIETCNRHRLPLLFVQDVSGFMVGVEAEQSGIIRAGAHFVEAMATATVPKLVLTVNHASGAGYYAMAGQGFDPNFIFSLPTGRMGVMEGESAVMALFSAQLERLKAEGKSPDADLQAEMDAVRATYEAQLDARFAAARGFCDAVLPPEDLRPMLRLALETCLNQPGPHLGPFVLTGNLP
ncbi:acyl-CoA carboxylase subunit beta [Chloracidobacterium thermophilum]|uniref:acyl-CoA carboxylase subunit beta n=1 Tax=Chloracidobacterium thermophilum TaxID=458033 RepID=UPI000738A969|nr:carboxyl transferase domain-containing protein [Chloracidobacterium thermophilum]